MERRDDEIGRLRSEVSKLMLHLKNLKLGEDGSGGDMEMMDTDFGFDLDLDLERDLDAVELQTRSCDGLGNGVVGMGTGIGTLGSVGEQPEEEDDGD